jgi:hypothetical protein
MDFSSFCQQVSLPLCPLVGNKIEPLCYARNVELGGLIVFQPATIVILVIAMIMTLIMIYHIRSKYTAVGRKEIVMFFYVYLAVCAVELVLVAGFVPLASSAYQWFAAIHVALISTQFWVLLLNGFIGFQYAEDGTPASVWSIRISGFIFFAISFSIAICTFMNIGLSSANPVGLFVIYFVFNGTMLLIYVIMQIILVVNTLDDRWPLGDVLFGVGFFLLGQIFQLFLSVQVCEVAKHYVDGLFFGTICSLLGVMMVYKFWHSITLDDLEFSVGGKANVWEIKDEQEPLVSGMVNNDDSIEEDMAKARMARQ